MLNIRQLKAALGVPFWMVERYVEKLEEISLSREATGQARDRIYWADEILLVIEGYDLT